MGWPFSRGTDVELPPMEELDGGPVLVADEDDYRERRDVAKPARWIVQQLTDALAELFHWSGTISLLAALTCIIELGQSDQFISRSLDPSHLLAGLLGATVLIGLGGLYHRLTKGDSSQGRASGTLIVAIVVGGLLFAVWRWRHPYLLPIAAFLLVAMVVPGMFSSVKADEEVQRKTAELTSQIKQLKGTNKSLGKTAKSLTELVQELFMCLGKANHQGDILTVNLARVRTLHGEVDARVKQGIEKADEDIQGSDSELLQAHKDRITAQAAEAVSQFTAAFEQRESGYLTTIQQLRVDKEQLEQELRQAKLVTGTVIS